MYVARIGAHWRLRIPAAPGAGCLPEDRNSVENDVGSGLPVIAINRLQSVPLRPAINRERFTFSIADR